MNLKMYAAAVISALCIGTTNATDTKSSTNPVKSRLPVINTPADVEALTYLDSDEKKMAIENLKKVPPTDGWRMLGGDPDVQALWQLQERINTSLLYPDFQAKPFGPMSFINLLVGEYSGNEYLIGIMNSFTIRTIKEYGYGEDYYTKLTMLEFPDSNVWTDEERITIKFVNAALHNTMTDQLFNQALGLWGEKLLLRHLSWISFVNGWAMLLNTLDVHYELSMRPPPGAMTPESIDIITNNLKDTKLEARQFWRSLVEFKE